MSSSASASCPASLTSYGWTRLIDAGKLSAEQLPVLGRSSHAVAIVGTKVYLFGGEHEPRKPVDDSLFEYDITDSSKPTWTPVPVDTSSPSPCARIAPGFAASSSSLWVFGGRFGVDMGEGALDDLWTFDTKTLKWTLVQESTENAGGPTARSFHQMVAWDGDLYVFGGCGASGRKADLWQYSVSKGMWEELPSSGVRGRGGAGIVAAQGKIIMTGGFAGEETNEMWAYDIATRVWEDWSAYSSSLVKRSVFGVAALGTDHLVLFGGEVDPSSQGHEGAGGFAGDTLFFDMQEKEKGWKRIDNLAGEPPSPRGWYASAFSPEVGFVVSGGLVGSNERRADFYVLKPTTTTA